MDWKQAQGNWTQLQGRLREIWGDLTDDDIAGIEGRQEQLIGCIQHRYGISREDAEAQVHDWLRRL